MNILRQNLSYLVSKHELSANALAQASGASQATISRILSGDSTDPRIQSLEPIAKYFKMETEELRSSLIPGAESLELEPERQSRRKTQVLGRLSHAPSKGRWTEFSGALLEDQLLRSVAEQAPTGIKESFNHRKDRITFTDLDFPREWDYASDALALNIKTIPVRFQLGEQHYNFGYSDHVTELLWHMSTKRLIEKADRRSYVLAAIFVDTETKEAINFIRATDSFSRIRDEAEIHGITITQATPSTLLSVIQEIEKLAATGR